jgi:hypothetical protein
MSKPLGNTKRSIWTDLHFFLKITLFICLSLLLGLIQQSRTLNADGTKPSPTPRSTLSATQRMENQSLLLEFHRAQKSELKALGHRYKFEQKELKISQEAHRKEWEQQEKDARYKFFGEHPQGKDRRTYIGDFIKRRESLQKQLKDEQIQRAQEQETHLKMIQKEQAEKLMALKVSLEEGKKPALELWPKAGQ